MSQKTVTKVCAFLFLICMANYAAFAVVSFYLGGNALHGEVKDGQYYVGDHARLTEVPHATYLYSQVHACSIYVTHPIAIIVALVAANRVRKNRDTGTAA